MRRFPPALAVVPLVLFLVGCTTPDPKPTPLNSIEACAKLHDAVVDFYDIVSANSSVTELKNYDLPDVNSFHIPKPSCAFQVRPDPAVIPGDVFTIEAFYLDYNEEMTLTLSQSLEASGFRRSDPHFTTWSASRLGRSYSAAMLLFQPGDGQNYSEAAEHFRILDLSIGQN